MSIMFQNTVKEAKSYINTCQHHCQTWPPWWPWHVLWGQYLQYTVRNACIY